MIREPVTLPQRPRISMRSSARFFHLVDVIARASEPTATQLMALERSYNSTGEFLSACPELQGDLIQIHAHGSRQLGTIVRPRDGSREGFDIDLIARLASGARHKYDGEHGPALLLDRLHRVLSRYADAHGLRLRRWERCATLEYAEGMCADIAPVIDSPLLAAPFGDTHGLIPDRELRLFDSTNPRGYAKHFDLAAAISPNFTGAVRFAEAMDSVTRAEVTPLPDAQEVFDRLLCRLVQLLKLHRNVAFGVARGSQDMAPSSVFLTTLAAMAYAVEAPQPHESPLELLLDIVERMPLHFERISRSDGSEEWVLPNPSAPRDNLAGGMNSPARQEAFFSWHHRLIGDLKRILHAIENHEGMDVLIKALEGAFGPHCAGAIQQDQTQRRQTSRAGQCRSATPYVFRPLMTPYPAPPIPTLAQRAMELRALPLDGARMVFLSGRALRYRFRLVPSDFGRVYECELRLTPDSRPPEMFVLSPALTTLADEAALPHVYPNNGPGTKLCLWWPKQREWLPQMKLVDTYIAWTSEWLWHFEDWLITGVWAGGGEHPQQRRKRWA